jgi:hypothetical protein
MKVHGTGKFKETENNLVTVNIKYINLMSKILDITAEKLSSVEISRNGFMEP